MQYEVVLDGKVILRSRDNTICNVDPPFCNLPAGGKLSPKKRVEKKKRRRKKVRIKEMKERKNGRKKKEEMKEGKEKRRNKEGIKRGLRNVFFTLNYFLTFIIRANLISCSAY